MPLLFNRLGAGAVIYVFSTVDRASFDDLPKWRRKVEEECGQICSVLVQNKIDLKDDAAMTRDEVEDMADHLNMRLYRSCVQDNINVGEGSGDDGDEMVHAVTDISTLSQTVKSMDISRHASSPEPRAKREISDISDIDSDRTSTAAPSPTSQSHLGRSFPPSPPTIIDREYDSDSGNEDSSPRKSDKQIKSRRYSRRDSGEEERELAQETEESPRRAPSGREYEFVDDENDLDGDEGVNSSEEPKLRPSKRRTNGKKTHPPPDCVIS
ncbi:unnamed protein product [Phytophthora fragariaefolia]|uniref:Unnamed protein product n=1 Tax=Phytophthora fragariaefolia TaxID=1490495 RepID=A0A9W6XYK0_9STRA|nr:unnamed protein product [Phytophthora fragariaefolia]